MYKSLGFLLIVLFFSACGAQHEDISEQKSETSGLKSENQADEMMASRSETEVSGEEKSINPQMLTSLAAKAIYIDSMYKFVKNANLHFRTKDVIQASLGIEKLVNENAGFIEDSDIRSEEKELHTVPFNDDFDKEIKKFTTISTITARIPSARLNDFLIKLQPFVVYLDHRNVSSAKSHSISI